LAYQSGISPRGSCWAEGIALLWLAFYSLRWYYHEKDKVKKTLKALGRVRVNHHGRLVVVKN
jgi:DNA-binding Lrp family transcriptional regulator